MDITTNVDEEINVTRAGNFIILRSKTHTKMIVEWTKPIDAGGCERIPIY